jgi:hypothetical protein
MRCPGCASRLGRRVRVRDGVARHYWKCIWCGWESEEAGVWAFDELTERIRDGRGEDDARGCR